MSAEIAEIAARRGVRTIAARRVVRGVDERELRELVRARPGVRASVLLPVEPPSRSPQQGGAVLRHALESLAKKLAGWPLEGGDGSADRWCERLHAVSVGAARHGVRALAIWIEEGATWLHPLVIPAAPAVRVARDFRVRELLRSLECERPWRVLALSANRVQLFAGDAHGLRPLEVPGLPGSLVEALGEQRVGASRAAKDRRLDLERFHRVVAEALRTGTPADGPLVLAADAPHRSGFRAVARLPELLADGVEGSPDPWSDAELHARAWPHVLARVEAAERKAAAQWQQARRRGKALTRLADVAAAAAAGRVRRLWLDADGEEPGRVDPGRGILVPGAGDDDALDSLVCLVLRHGGTAHPVAGRQLPDGHAAVAELR